MPDPVRLRRRHLSGPHPVADARQAHTPRPGQALARAVPALTLPAFGISRSESTSARAWTEAPESVQQLWSQRYRWSYGTMQAIWKHRRALFERGPSGRFGRVGLPLVSLFMVVAPLPAPLIDLFLVYGLVFGPTAKTIGAWCGVLAVQAVCAAYAFALDRERLRSCAAWAAWPSPRWSGTSHPPCGRGESNVPFRSLTATGRKRALPTFGLSHWCGRPSSRSPVEA